MSEQWTEQDPGAGSAVSLMSLASALGTTGELLEAGQSDVVKSLGIFPDDWAGLAAGAAKSQIEGIKTRSGKLGDAAVAVKKALNAYADELEEIKRLANPQKFLRDVAQTQINEFSYELNTLSISGDHLADLKKRNEIEINLKAAQDAESEALNSLKELARRRLAADRSVLEALRAVIAANWELPPHAYPSDRLWEQQLHYEYDMDHFLGFSTDQYTAKELMDLFKKYPSEIFPFLVKGPDGGFRDGAVFELSGTLPADFGDIETGRVVVTTTDTSVKFTVVSDAYFDGPGSTIEFSVVEKDGKFYLRKVADAEEAQAGVAQSAKLGAFFTWLQQSENFKDVVNKYGKGSH